MPYKNSEVFERYIEGLIKAGLKGTPSGYSKMVEENKLNGNEIKELLFNKKISGKMYGFGWSASIRNKEKYEYTHPFGKIYIGKCWIDGDALCRRFESLYGGIKHCLEIYKSPEDNKNELSEYLLLTEFGIFPFSIIE